MNSEYQTPHPDPPVSIYLKQNVLMFSAQMDATDVEHRGTLVTDQ